MLLNFVRLGGLQLSMVEISWVGILQDINFLGGNFREWEFSRWELSWVEIFRVGIVRVGVILGGNFPGGNCPDGSYPRWEFSLVGASRVGIVRRESSGWPFSWWEFSCYRSLFLNLNTAYSDLTKIRFYLKACGKKYLNGKPFWKSEKYVWPK